MKGYVVLSIEFHSGNDETFRIGPLDEQPEELVRLFHPNDTGFQFEGQKADLPGWSEEAFFCIPKTSVRMATWGYLPIEDTLRATRGGL